MNETRFDKRMKKIRQDADRILVEKDTKIVVMSDCHRGNGGWNDNFADNEKIYFTALNDYYEQNYTYIELGDGDELWENKDYHRIIQLYSHIFWRLSTFYKEERMYMVYGNHDMQKKNREFNEKYLSKYFNEAQNSYASLFPGIKIKEGLLLVIPSEKRSFAKEVKTILLVHGNQGELLNDTLGRVAKGLVRYFWKPLELLGVKNPISAAGNYAAEPRHPIPVEKWAEKEKQKLIAGHTHRPVCEREKEAYYFNSGSCVHPRCITAIEIEREELRLVKWFVDTDESKHLVVKKECLSTHAL